MKDPFENFNSFLQDPFINYNPSVQDPFKNFSPFIQDPFINYNSSFQDPLTNFSSTLQYSVFKYQSIFTWSILEFLTRCVYKFQSIVINPSLQDPFMIAIYRYKGGFPDYKSILIWSVNKSESILKRRI